MSIFVRDTIMIVDDHPAFRQGLRRLIEDAGRFRVVAEAATGYEAIRFADLYHPHIILSDIQLPGVTGLKIARILKKQHPSTQIIICSMHVDDERLFDAVRAGASAFLSKDIESHELLNAIAQVADGEQPINQTVLARPLLAWRVLSELRTIADTGMTNEGLSANATSMPLSVREVEVLDCVAQGLSNREIAEALYITEQTVKNHMTSVLRKLEVTDRVQAVLYAVKHGWVEIGSITPDDIADQFPDKR
ncbi:MAG TPA: response regulator transcription factor [Thermomicrobiales bacterium]|nr:response regulator transcription factor [Thermomicrobiales bacterium]